MLLLLSPSTDNKQAANSLVQFINTEIILADQLTETSLNDAEPLIFVDVDADDKFLTYFEPQTLAALLLKHGLSGNTRTLIFLISDVNKQKNLYEFTHPMLLHLHNLLQQEIIAYIPFNPNYESIVLAPPAGAQKNWRVYGIPEWQKPEFEQTDLAFFLSLKNKALLWEGENILHWLMASPPVTIKPLVNEKVMFRL
ncbi:hypothetical protein [Legionella septentrionalis]|uniref:Uncharacterized protein n=1 Tax=Legionella septentrionalis TaxID=2498109 RepID=A0A433JJS0_9GAMM|nr:hypothetical protein [Legionella septentrionalis]RUQ88654.1 hypothetical protein EKM59_04920 [Legionella septentrionalis]